MTVKRSNLLEDPPTASSSDEDEVETSIGEGEEIAGNSSSDEDDDSSKNRSVKKPESSLAATTEKQVSDTESGSDEETDSDSETEKKDPVKTNPVSSVVKPVIETKDSSVKNQDSKKVKTSEKSTAKRPRETDGGGASTDVKRVKRVSGEEEKKSGVGGGEETKKTYFQRVWSEDDEIAVLQGIIDYKTETGLSPYDDTNGFYQLVKKSISFDVSKIQFMEKLRSLKKKYENNVGKAKNGEEPIFLKSHDRKAFDLSKNIWGANGMGLESAVKSNGKLKKSRKSKKVEYVKQELVSSLLNGKNCEDEVTNKGDVSSLEMDEFLKSVLVKSLARLGVDDLAAQQGWRKLASEDKKRFEEQWKMLQLREFEFYSQKSGFVHEVVTKMAEAFRSNP